MVNPEIKQILDEPEGNTPLDQVELTVAAGGKIQIAGFTLPAPAAAVIAMLELIDSPFVTGRENDEVTDLAVFRALYLIAERDKAVPPILKWKRREEALERLKNQFDTEESPQTVLIIAEMLKTIADAQAEFDIAAMRFGESLGAFNVADAASQLGFYLSLAGGFDMLPNGGGSKKKQPLT